MTTTGMLARVTTVVGTRRRVLTGGAGMAASLALGTPRADAQDGATPTATQSGDGSTAHLLVADRNVDWLYFYAIPGFELTGQLENIGFGIHGGALQLEDGRLIFADVLNNEVVALAISDTGQPQVVQQVAAELGGGVSWISANPALTHVAVGSLIGDEGGDGPRQFLNLIDLERFSNTELEFEMEQPEEITPWLLGDPLQLHVALGGQINSYDVSDLLAGNIMPLSEVPVDLESHGGATDAVNGRLFYTTGPGNGFDVLDVTPVGAEYLAQIPWDIDTLSGGRNARPRVLRDGKHIFGVMTPGLDDTSVWAETVVSNHVTDMDAMSARRLPIDVGTIGYRWGLSDRYALWAGYNGEGARAYLIDADPASETFATVLSTIDVAMPSQAAIPGEPYEGAEFYLMTAITADSTYGFVTISGDGLIQVIDLAAGEVIADIQTPSPLAGGGYTTVVQAGIAPVDLRAR